MWLKLKKSLILIIKCSTVTFLRLTKLCHYNGGPVNFIMLLKCHLYSVEMLLYL